MQQPVRVARISDRALSVDALLASVNDAAVGGIVLFVGTVRDHDGPDRERQVRSLDYTAHPSAEQRLAEVADRAARIDGVHAVAVEHRVGALSVGDLAVVIAVGAEHRGQAFESCRLLIDELKAGVPIWKEQTFADGVAEWVALP